MGSYIEVIKVAFAAFPVIAFIISAPFIIWQYHKYGSIALIKILIIYSLVLYLTCAYFLVILPLPKIDEVAKMTSPTTQLVPFKFVADFFRETSFRPNDIHTFLPALTESAIFVPVYNVLLTLPFGIYLRYYFRCNWKEVLVYSFLLSLFFELTQLSGLYGIYPRGYRLFDVDDLLLNTVGGMLGYLVAGLIMRVLPSREEIDTSSRERGKQVSGLRRATAFGLDLALFLVLSLSVNIIVSSFIKNGFYILIECAIIYYIVLPALLGSATVGEKFLNLRVVDCTAQPNILKFYLRNILISAIYVIVPTLFVALLMPILQKYPTVGENWTLIIIVAIGVYDMASLIKLVFTNQPMLYEKLSGTRLVSSIQ